MNTTHEPIHADAVSGGTPPADDDRASGEPIVVPLSLIDADPDQPRRNWRHDEGDRRMSELTQSVQERGILQPLLLRRTGDRYTVIAGGRRLRAARRAVLQMGIPEDAFPVPAIVQSPKDATETLVLQLIENLQRQDLSAVDQGRGYVRLRAAGLTPAHISLLVKRGEQHVREMIKIAEDPDLAAAVESGHISKTVARDINQLPDQQKAELVARVVKGKRITTKDIEATRAWMAEHDIVNPRLARRVDHPTRGRDLPTNGAVAPQDNQWGAFPEGDADDADGLPPGLTAVGQVELPAWMKSGGRPAPRTDREALDQIQEDFNRTPALFTPAPSPTREAATDARAKTASRDMAPIVDASATDVDEEEDEADVTVMFNRLQKEENDWERRLLSVVSRMNIDDVRELLLLGSSNGLTCALLYTRIETELRKR